MVEDNKTSVRVDSDNPISDLVEKGEETIKDVEEVVQAIETGGIDAAVDKLKQEPIIQNNPLAGDAVSTIGECGQLFNALKTQNYPEAISSITQIAVVASQIPAHFQNFKEEKLPMIEEQVGKIKESGKELVAGLKENAEKFVHDIKNIHSLGDFMQTVSDLINGIKDDIGLGKDTLEQVNGMTDVITKNAQELKQESHDKSASTAKDNPVLAAAQGLSGAVVENASTPGGAPHTPSDPGQGQDQGGPAVG